MTAGTKAMDTMMTEAEIERADHELAAEYRRLNPLGRISIRRTTAADLRDTLAWLRREQDTTGHSFYCNRHVIGRAHKEGEAFVARVNGRCAGLLVDCGHGPEIVTTHPAYRRRGIGRALLRHSAARARRRCDKDIRADCVTEAGERLCRAMGFQATGKRYRGFGGGTAYVLPVGRTTAA